MWGANCDLCSRACIASKDSVLPSTQKVTSTRPAWPRVRRLTTPSKTRLEGACSEHNVCLWLCGCGMAMAHMINDRARSQGTARARTDALSRRVVRRVRETPGCSALDSPTLRLSITSCSCIAEHVRWHQQSLPHLSVNMRRDQLLCIARSELSLPGRERAECGANKHGTAARKAASD